jgi:stage V sporulation protein SpoVS
MSDRKKKTLLVSGHTDVTKLAGAIAKSIRDQDDVMLSCLGAAAIHTAGKALAAARAYLVSGKIALRERPFFELTKVDGADRNLMCVSLEPYAMY